MADKSALIVDDEPDIRELLEITLGRMGIATDCAADLSEARQQLSQKTYDLCLTDMNLPDGSGISLVEHIQATCSDMPVAMITAYGSIETAISALKAGAFDFVSKPIELDRLRTLVSTALKLQQPETQIQVESPTELEVDPTGLLGQSEAMDKLRLQIRKLARSQAPVFISGESGSGKEVVARAIHHLGPRSGNPFIPVNCGAIPSELMESEFFGHKKGSFSGAVSDKEGLFQAAAGGTLFLDEVADLPLSMQVKLLRAIQEKAVRAIGSQKEDPIDVRILSATHKDLAEEIKANRFRNDLFYRINVIELKVPSLRERQSDIPLLAKHFLSALALEWQLPSPTLSNEAQQALLAYTFPGNVRELENILQRAFTLCDEDTITATDLQLLPTDGDSTDGTPYAQVNPSQDHFDSLEEYLEGIEKEAIINALEQTKWNKTAAAKKLGISFRALRYRLQKLNLD